MRSPPRPVLLAIMVGLVVWASFLALAVDVGRDITLW